MDESRYRMTINVSGLLKLVFGDSAPVHIIEAEYGEGDEVRLAIATASRQPRPQKGAIRLIVDSTGEKLAVPYTIHTEHEVSGWIDEGED